MLNNNMFGNQQSMRPNFMGAMQRRQQYNLSSQDISAYKQAAQPWALQQSTAYQPSPPMSPAVAIKAPRPSMPPGFGDEIPDYSSARPPAIPTADPQTPSPQGMSLNLSAMRGRGIIQNPAMTTQAFGLERARQYQANRSAAAANAPQYINPTGRAIQSQLAQSNQSLAGTLNQRLDRRFDLNPGATAESNVQRQLAGGMIPTSSGFQPRQDTGEARNVLAGQPMGLDRTMRALNIPGMHLEGNRMIKDAPQAIGGANVPARGLGGMTPNQFRNYQEIARRDGGPAGVEAALANGFGADGEENAGIGILNRQAQIMKRNPDGVNTGLSSNYQNVKDSRMARRMGFGSVSSFRNFMNQYNARQNRVASPFGVGATAGAMATQGLLQGRSGKSGQESSASEKNNGTLLPLDAIKQQAKFSVGQLSRVPSRVERAANDATTTSINGVFSGPGFGFPGMRFLR